MGGVEGGGGGGLADFGFRIEVFRVWGLGGLGFRS